MKTVLRDESARRASLTIAGGALRSEDETITIPGNPQETTYTTYVWVYEWKQ